MDRETIIVIAIAAVWAVFFVFVAEGRFSKARKLDKK